MNNIDYSLQMKRCILEAKREETQNMLAIMESESDFMLACLESMSIVDGLDVITEAKTGPSLWEKISEFFKNLFNIFTEKARKLSGANTKWLLENGEKLKNVSCDNISIEMVPFWNIPDDKIKNTFKTEVDTVFKNINSVLGLIINSPDKISDNDIIKKRLNPMTKYADASGDETEGFKNFLRVGNSKSIKPISIGGKDLQQKIGDFIDYCLNYDKNIVSYIKQQIKNIDNEIKIIQKKTSSIKEHTLFIEDCNILQTELRYCRGFHKLREDASENKTSVTDININKKEESNNDTNNEKDNKSEDKSQNTQKKENTYNNYSGKELRYINEALTKIKLMLTIALSVFEERYVTYMKVLRSLIKESKPEPQENIVNDIKNKK